METQGYPQGEFLLLPAHVDEFILKVAVEFELSLQFLMLLVRVYEFLLAIEIDDFTNRTSDVDFEKGCPVVGAFGGMLRKDVLFESFGRNGLHLRNVVDHLQLSFYLLLESQAGFMEYANLRVVIIVLV